MKTTWFLGLAGAWQLVAGLALAQSAPAPAASVPALERKESAGTWVGVQPLAETLTGEAKAGYAAGRILFDDQDYAGALVKFQRAFEQSGEIRLLWNMAVCEKSLRHYARVQTLVERYWREGSARMSEVHRRDVQSVLDTVRMLISTVRIQVNEPGAQISVDGDLIGVSPLGEPVRVDLGRRRIQISKPEFEPRIIEQEFAGGSDTTFAVALVPKPRDGAVEVVTADDATIRIDGQIVGMGRWKGNLLAGTHGLRITAVDKQTYNHDLAVLAGQPLRTLYIDLEKAESGVPAWVWVGAGVVAVGGLAVGGYFLFRPGPNGPEPAPATLGVVQL